MQKEKYITRNCQRHGDTKFVLEKRGYYRCTKCRSMNVSNARKKKKIMLIEYFGGKCTVCGYKKYMGSLTFHHLDPNKKEFGLSERGLTRSFKKAVKEAEKCILVCNNCHGEIHAGMHPEYLS